MALLPYLLATVLLATVLLATVTTGLALLAVRLAVGLTVMLVGHSYTLGGGFILEVRVFKPL